MGYLIVLLSSLTTTTGDMLAKYWAQKPQWPLYVLVIACYMMSALLFPIALLYGKLTTINAVGVLCIFVATSSIGLFYFHEKMSTMQLVGLGLALIAIALISFGERSV